MQRKKKSRLDRFLAFIDSFKPDKTPAERIADHLAEVQGAAPMELSGKLAAALAAKKTLDGTQQVELPFPDAYFEAGAPVDDAARATLNAYAEALIKFQVDCIDFDTPLTTTVGNGLTTWIALTYSLSTPGQLEQGRAIWAKLAEGRENVDEANKHLLRRASTELEKSYFSYSPAAFKL